MCIYIVITIIIIIITIFYTKIFLLRPCANLAPTLRALARELLAHSGFLQICDFARGNLARGAVLRVPRAAMCETVAKSRHSLDLSPVSGPLYDQWL